VSKVHGLEAYVLKVVIGPVREARFCVAVVCAYADEPDRQALMAKVNPDCFIGSENEERDYTKAVRLHTGLGKACGARDHGLLGRAGVDGPVRYLRIPSVQERTAYIRKK